MIMNQANLKSELDKYKTMLYTCKTDDNLKLFIEKEIERIKLELNAINERRKRNKK